ncbi:Panacea domain-containing protein [Bosea sp. (in: a-proteobacteria)]|uniref:Panacea domain-containing protein n=1 Tax=Bosea sp. (in: a-proteobacteria) TaxID=1871050 RepID=UPI002DDCC768|nr:Panacea domain-containing protein [Bosea sp. (in: a-proteobacteria)]HEV2508602.1 Panacea domain-containing protein [Bosea sp. (in: a-proteobacteria)]
MLITHEREKLIQAINFFVRNTKKCGKVKLFKLLYFLDFEHFKQTGRSVTGQNYFAWPKGPVPVDLNNEIENPMPDMAEAFQFQKKPIKDSWALDITPNVEFSERNFTKREMMILKNLAEEYKNADANSMIEATHLENLPWDKIYNQDRKKQQIIPYELSIRNDERDRLIKIVNDRQELLEKLR